MCVPTDEASEHSKRIDKFITDDLKRSRTELRILLLGTGESGKSTVIKQMRINYGEGFDLDSRAKLRPNIYRNIYTAIQYLINGMDALKLRYVDRSISDREIDALLGVDLNEMPSQFPLEHQVLIKKFLSDSKVQHCITHHEKIHMTKSAVDFLHRVDEIFHADYVPSVQDILLERTPSTGIKEYMFSLKHGGKKISFRMMDVGGQKNERKKWIHAFEGVHAIIFVTAISEYDQEMEEEPGTNRLTGSVNLFHQVGRLEWFPPRYTSLILFLNKVDLFATKIRSASFSKHFPSYQGGSKDENAVKKFIEQMFFVQSSERTVYSHFTCAIDTKQIKKIFDCVKSDLIDRHLQDIVGAKL